MNKIYHVALREFIAAVTAKGFLFGILLTPAIVVFIVFLLPRLTSSTPPKLDGQVAILDPTGEIAKPLADYLSPENLRERQNASRKLIREVASAEMGGGAAAAMLVGRSGEEALEAMPQITVLPLPTGAVLDEEKDLLKIPLPKHSGEHAARLGLVVVHPNAVQRGGGTESFGSYDLYVREGLDDRLTEEIHSGLRVSIRGLRLQSAGIRPDLVTVLTRVDRPQTLVITRDGERQVSRMMNQVLPPAFMILLMISVITSSASLMTTTIEEKSSRIVELLLSALTSMQLMTGKILGQMGVGLLILVIYTGLGLASLASFAMTGILDPALFFFLLVFFVLSYLTIAALMAAIGSAVSDLRDAQSLMTPMMMVFMVPWLMMVPISSHPNSVLAIVLSFIPPIGSFVMLLRMASNTPPPMWQAVLSVLVSAVGAYLALRFAAKVFRIGILLYGKPPSFATLVRWARMPD